MRKLIYFWLFISSVVHADKAMQVNVQAGKTQFQVSLAANPTTGYQWRLKQYDSTLLKIASKQFIAPRTQLIGAGGNMLFIFQLIKGVSIPKSTELQFEYVRPWENNTGFIKTITVNFEDSKK